MSCSRRKAGVAIKRSPLARRLCRRSPEARSKQISKHTKSRSLIKQFDALDVNDERLVRFIARLEQIEQCRLTLHEPCAAPASLKANPFPACVPSSRTNRRILLRPRRAMRRIAGPPGATGSLPSSASPAAASRRWFARASSGPSTGVPALSGIFMADCDLPAGRRSGR